MKIRKYLPGEEKYIWDLFYNTIHNINVRDYTIEQIEAWAPSDLDENIWTDKIIEIDPYVVVAESKIVAYADLQENGYIDHFYCHHEHQRKGVGSFLFSFLEQLAISKNISKLVSDVSITAKPFFESRGFIVIKKQFLNKRGQSLENYKMAKHIITD
ncbi:MAG: GNAT family N-acetyltransferase [Desulfocapsaceae bacterium]|nr:GNAT family N-acetyltransferase [Desulfocapsaceae bacterium]